MLRGEHPDDRDRGWAVDGGEWLPAGSAPCLCTAAAGAQQRAAPCAPCEPNVVGLRVGGVGWAPWRWCACSRRRCTRGKR